MGQVKSRTVMIGDVPCGDGHPPVFVAEIGSFFKKDLSRAIDFLKRTVDAGAPVFKTEILHNADVVVENSDLNHTFNHAQGKTTQNYRELIEERVVPLSGYERLFDECRKLNIPTVASVFDLEGVDFLKDVGAAGVKVSRNYANHFELIRKALESGLPLIVDIGEVYFSETLKIVEMARELDADLIINHHPGPNPSAANIHNLRIMDTYKEMFDCPVGLSDHYRGDLMLYVATACGANMLEKGVVDDADAAEADIVSACEFSQLEDIIHKVNESWAALGDGKDWTKPDRNLSGRAGMTAVRDMKKGEALTLGDLMFAWPPLGITSDYWDVTQGSLLSQDVKKGEPITWQHIGVTKND